MLRNDAIGKGAYGAPRGRKRTHQGIDLLVAAGNPVFASKSGRVSMARFGSGYGLFVEIQHPEGYSTCYAHLSELTVRNGDWVTEGSVIGRAGKSGNANNPEVLPHVHFEIRSMGKAVDPLVNKFDPAIVLKSS